jgi:P2 family phage contractile tail tube protein
MGQIAVKRVTNANVYVDGNSLLGKVQEATLPVIKYKASDHAALGMIGTVEFFSGIDKLEAKLKWTSFYEDVLKKVADPFKTFSVQLRSSVETYGAAGRTEEKPMVAYMTVQSKDFPAGSFKQHDNAELESTLNVTYYKLVIDGKDIVEIDVMSNIYKVDGKDVLSTYRANIGG